MVPNPPQIIRCPSNGISGMSFPSMPSSILRAASSQVARSGQVVHDMTITSPSLASTARYMSVRVPWGTSTPQLSWFPSAPKGLNMSFHASPASLWNASLFSCGTGVRNP